MHPSRLRAAIVGGALAALTPALASAQPSPNACTAPKTSCTGANGYYASKADLDRVTAVSEPLLRELRACLDGAGGKQVTPSFVIRWDAEGNPVAVKVDAPGYDTLPCVSKISAKLSQLQNPHETAIRCEYGCGSTAAPPPLPPVVVPPPPAQPAQPAQVGPQPSPQSGVIVIPPPTLSPALQEKTEKVWYGWQILIADAIAFTVTLAGGFTGTTGVTTTGVIGFVFTGPIIHMAHSEVGRGFGSMGMRILLPLTGAGIGAIVGAASGVERDFGFDDRGDPIGTGAAFGALIGGGICTILDITALGFKTVTVDGSGRTARRPPPPAGPRVTFAPSFDRHRASLGLAGVF